MIRWIFPLLVFSLINAPVVWAAEVNAPTSAQFQAALRNAKPGDHILLGEGPYSGPFYWVGVKGTAEKPIRISGPSAQKPAIMSNDKGYILQMPNAAYIEMENIHITHATGHGLMFDDGFKKDWSCHHITLRHLRIDDIGPKTTTCSIKLAGMSDFVITDCSFRNFGNSGCAIDAVVCKNGTVERCTFEHGATGAVAVQFKGGSENMTVRNCVFDDPSPGAISIGGSTGLAFFHPELYGFEARRVTVENNVFIGCDAPICFANTDGADVRFNTFYLPRMWAFRILQETDRPDFTPSRNGRIENNIIVFNSKWYEGGINVGVHTAPQTFKFTGNAWYCVDNPAKSKPTLPTVESDGIIGHDPMFTDPIVKDFSLRSGSPARGKGHSGAPQ